MKEQTTENEKKIGLGNYYRGVENAKTQLLKNNSTPNPNYSSGAEQSAPFFYFFYFNFLILSQKFLEHSN